VGRSEEPVTGSTLTEHVAADSGPGEQVAADSLDHLFWRQAFVAALRLDCHIFFSPGTTDSQQQGRERQ